MTLTDQELKQLLSYDQKTGVFRWRVAPCRNIKVGEVAGTLSHGYVRIRYRGQYYFGHRLAWLFIHGCRPSNDVDHINGIRDDNRIENLRDVTRSVNLQNQRSGRAGKIHSTLLGVTKRRGQWISALHLGGKRRFLGAFSTPEEAHAAYLAAKRELHEGCTI